MKNIHREREIEKKIEHQVQETVKGGQSSNVPYKIYFSKDTQKKLTKIVLRG